MKKQETKALTKTKETLEALVAIAHQCGVPETEISTVHMIYHHALNAELYGDTPYAPTVDIDPNGAPLVEGDPPAPAPSMGPFDAVVPQMMNLLADMTEERRERREEREKSKAKPSKKAKKK